MSENAQLSEREIEILKLVATGASNKEISRQLVISENTTKVHLRNIFAKLGVASRTEATLYAIRAGWVEHPAAPTSPPTPPLIGEGSKDEIPSAPRAAIAWQRWTIIALAAMVLVAILLLALSFRQQPSIASASPAAIPAATTRWKTRAAMTAPRASLAVVAYDNKIYAIGGEGANGASATNERYDPATDAWETLAPKPTAVSEGSAAVIRGRVYVPGGRLASGKTTDALEVYDPDANEWDARAPLPLGMSAYALAAYEGKLYVFGGWDGTDFIASVYEYDPESDAWRARAPLPTPRGHASAVIAGGKIFVLGGFDGKQALAVNEQYAPDRDIWTPRRALPAARYAMGAASVADFIYVIGGKTEENAPLAALQYIYQSDTWNVVASPISQSWSNVGAAAVQTHVYALGGRVGGNLSAQNQTYQAIFTLIIPTLP